MITLKTIAEFTWNFGQNFFLETKEGNFIWSDPDYGGNNTIYKTTLSYGEWIDPNNCGCFGRSKGQHEIGRYCGEDVKIVKFGD